MHMRLLFQPNQVLYGTLACVRVSPFSKTILFYRYYIDFDKRNYIIMIFIVKSVQIDIYTYSQVSNCRYDWISVTLDKKGQNQLPLRNTINFHLSMIVQIVDKIMFYGYYKCLYLVVLNIFSTNCAQTLYAFYQSLKKILEELQNLLSVTVSNKSVTAYKFCQNK